MLALQHWMVVVRIVVAVKQRTRVESRFGLHSLWGSQWFPNTKTLPNAIDLTRPENIKKASRPSSRLQLILYATGDRQRLRTG
jgi:hypothetical protein